MEKGAGNQCNKVGEFLQDDRKGHPYILGRSQVGHPCGLWRTTSVL